MNPSILDPTKPHKLVIVGAGDLGREICEWFPDVNVIGFLDSNPSAILDTNFPPIIGNPEEYEPQQDEVYICTISNPRVRLSVCRKMQERGARFVSLVHPTVLVAPSSSIGLGCILLPFSIIDIDTQVGDFVIFYFRSGIGHNAHVGDCCLLLSNSVVGSRCTIEQCVTVSTLSFTNTGIHVGEYSTIGANSFAAKSVPPYTTAIGVPARHFSLSKPDLNQSEKLEGKGQIHEAIAQ